MSRWGELWLVVLVRPPPSHLISAYQVPYGVPVTNCCNFKLPWRFPIQYDGRFSFHSRLNNTYSGNRAKPQVSHSYCFKTLLPTRYSIWIGVVNEVVTIVTFPRYNMVYCVLKRLLTTFCQRPWIWPERARHSFASIPFQRCNGEGKERLIHRSCRSYKKDWRHRNERIIEDPQEDRRKSTFTSIFRWHQLSSPFWRQHRS